ncbi:hypothetical protein PoB_001995100 [Plakobranchus ocellatus]|uniref:Uncharacterized protein n=1 Tax=Plakobranchus ocellatus TaxID=259542 RepID=A0AAV3ZFN9_9GAST|nr:hypothetical protein PoB_001995100 [Plakobranchus ocellatus]
MQCWVSRRAHRLSSIYVHNIQCNPFKGSYHLPLLSVQLPTSRPIHHHEHQRNSQDVPIFVATPNCNGEDCGADEPWLASIIARPSLLWCCGPRRPLVARIR